MTHFAVRNESYDAVVRSSFDAQGLMRHLGAGLARVEPGLVEITVPFRPEVTQQHGFFHAGVTSSIVDSACGYSALTLMPAGSEVLTVEFKINLIAPAAGEQLLARGAVVRSGRTITVCQGEVFGVSGGKHTHCASMMATMMRVELPSPADR